MKNRKRHSQKAFKDALCLLLEKKPLDKIFVKEILEAADYSSMAFYSSYEDKYDLAQKIIEEEAKLHIDTLFDIISLEITNHSFDQSKVFERSSNSFFTHVKENNKIYKCIFNNLLMPDAMEYFAQYSSIIIKDHFDFKNQNNDALKSYYNFFIKQSISMLLYAAKYWMSNNYNIPADDFSKLYSRYKSGWTASVLSINNQNKIEVSIQL